MAYTPVDVTPPELRAPALAADLAPHGGLYEAHRGFLAAALQV